MTSKKYNINKFIEHTNLKSSATEKDIIKLCDEAIRFSFYGVVVNPIFVKRAVKSLENEKIKIISVCDFPSGLNRTDKKILEANILADSRVDEIDMVANIEKITAHDFKSVANEIKLVRKEIPKNVILKVIIEAGLLTDEEIIDSVKAVIESEADFVKSSTGTTKNASLTQFKLIATTSSNKIRLKSSGGIKTLIDCHNFIDAGAHRIGTSSSIQIVKEYLSQRN